MKPFWKKRISDSKMLYPDGTEYVECLICGFRCQTLAYHLKIHNIRKEDYSGAIQTATLQKQKSKTAKKVSERPGYKNPFTGHGGRLSPLSKHNPKTTAESRRNMMLKMAENRTYTTQLNYWLLKGLTEEEAKAALHDRQSTFTLEKLEARYGKEIAKEKWQDRQDRWQNTLRSKPEQERIAINRKKATRINYSTLLGGSSQIENPAILYLIRWSDTGRLKIGITSRDLNVRHPPRKRIYTIVKVWENLTAGKAFEIEQSILWNNQDMVVPDGSFETFHLDMKEEHIEMQVDSMLTQSWEYLRENRKIMSKKKASIVERTESL